VDGDGAVWLVLFVVVVVVVVVVGGWFGFGGWFCGLVGLVFLRAGVCFASGFLDVGPWPLFFVAPLSTTTTTKTTPNKQTHRM
jgi:hypothetical protein